MEAESEHANDDEKERFPRGRIARFFPQSRYGFIKDRQDRDVYFHLEELRFVGEKGERDLVEGAEIGYDLSWTSRGEHVIKMKIY